MYLDLRASPHRATATLVEAQGRPASVRSELSLTVADGALQLHLRAWDPDPLNLLASAQLDRRWPALYEEDCLQVALALPGEPEPRQLLVVNALGQATGQAAWVQRATREADGWSLTLGLPLPTPLPATLGFSLHRYFRGIRGEVQGLAAQLSWPLVSAEMPVLVLAGPGDAATLAEAFRQTARDTRAAAITKQLAAGHTRLTASAPARPRLSYAFLAEMARDRDQAPVPSTVSGLCWDEAHYLMGLMALYELDHQPDWLARAARRITQIWDLRGSVRGQADSLWGEILPTWYDAPSGDGVCTLSAGPILRPIGRFIRHATETAAGAPWRAQAATWATMAREVYGVFQREFVPLPNGAGTWLEPYSHGPRRCYPRGGSRPNPFNRIHFLLLPMLDLLRLQEDPALRQQIACQARYFRQHCRVTPDDCLIWEYEPGAYPAGGEDLSHAACQSEFIRRCHEEGIEFSELDLRRTAQTLSRRVLRYGDVPVGELTGECLPEHDMALGAWCHLAPWAPEVLPATESLLAAALHEGRRDFIRHGWGIYLLSQLLLARKRG